MKLQLAILLYHAVRQQVNPRGEDDHNKHFCLSVLGSIAQAVYVEHDATVESKYSIWRTIGPHFYFTAVV